MVDRSARAIRGVWVALACAIAGCNAFDASALAPLASRPRSPDDGQHASEDAGLDAAMSSPPDRPGTDAATPELDSSLPVSDGGGDGASDLDATAHDAAEHDAAELGDAGEQDAGACSAAGTTDYCTALPQLPVPPVIDGVLDCGPPLRPIAPTEWNGATPIPANHSAQLALAYRGDGLYAYFEVRGQAPVPHPSDTNIYCGDAIELYLDADGVIASDGAYDEPGTVQLIFAAPAAESAPSAHAERFVSGATLGAPSSAYQTVWLEGGYALEAFITAADLGLASWSPATALGLDVVIDVAGPASGELRCGRQLGQYFLRVSNATPSSCNGEPWCDTRAFCLPTL